jgi:hypothetical protein
VSVKDVAVERKIALLEPMVTALWTLEHAADAIDLPLPLAREVAELHGYPDIPRMGHHLDHLRAMVGKPSPMAQVAKSLANVKIKPPDLSGFKPPAPRHTDVTPEPVYLEHLLARARRSRHMATQNIADRIERMVKDLEKRVVKEEQERAEKERAAQLEAKRAERLAELKAEMAALGGALACPHPECTKVYRYPAALAKHQDKEHSL